MLQLRNHEGDGMAGSVITVAQQKGGSGKTTLSANLAIGLRLAGQLGIFLNARIIGGDRVAICHRIGLAVHCVTKRSKPLF